MRLTQNDLIQEQGRLDAIIAEAEAALDGAPEEMMLRITHRNGKPRYYLRKGSGDTQGTYLPDDQHFLAQKIAQKEYDRKIAMHARKERRILRALINARVSGDGVESTLERDYSRLHPSRKKLVIPRVLSDEDYARRWESDACEGKALGSQETPLQTAKGGWVRSKSELVIANALFAHGVPYYYEKPVELAGVGVFHPDFTVLNKRTRQVFIWEHFGLMGDAEYTGRTMQKLTLYARNGFVVGKNLLLTMETGQRPLDSCVVESIITEVLL